MENESEQKLLRQEIREGYHNLLEDFNINRDELTRSDSDNATITETLTKANNLFKKVNDTREATLDSHLLCQVANLTRKRTEAINADLQTFQPLDFMEKVITLMNPAERLDDSATAFPAEKFIILGQYFMPMFRRSPSFHYMYGSFEKGPVDLKRTRKPKNKEDSSESSKEMKAKMYSGGESKTEEEKTTQEIERILGILHAVYKKSRNTPICYFEFVIDPGSFSKTIENIFHVSFLVKDGAANIYLDDDELPVIEPVLIKGGSSKISQQKSKQLIISMTMEEWKEIVKVFKIERSLLSREQKTKRKQ